MESQSNAGVSLARPPGRRLNSMIVARFWTALVLSSLPLAAAAQSPTSPYPSRPIKWVVPYTPGGITDTVTRIVTQKLQDVLGQPVVIENKPGANSLVGVDLV